MSTPARTMHMIGHGHIDPTWLWRWTEGYEEVRATFRSALDRMRETPEFTFTASSACFYAWVKACEPAMFEEIRQRVAEGRWELAGGWWIEPDCNIPGGEAIVRQGLFGQRFFDREFGKRAAVGFNPDSFGHAGTFPQLLAKMGIQRYVFMRPMPQIERDYPGGTTFWWVANDGSRVLACNLLISYNCGAEELYERVRLVAASPELNPGQTELLGFYGVGNHGGGPTKRAIAAILDAGKEPDLPRLVFSTLESYFVAFTASTPAEGIPTIDTNLQHHARGCYTAHAEVKRLNRRTEHGLMAAERWAAVALHACGHAYPHDALHAAWEDLLYNQFHDILAGSSLESSYDDMRDQLGAARACAQKVTNESLQVLARQIDTTPEGNTTVVFNPLPWAVTQTVTVSPIVARELDKPLHFVNPGGKVVPSQPVRGERIGHTAYALTVDVPALGYQCFHARPGARNDARTRGTLSASQTHLENDWWRLEFDPYSGELTRLFDKSHQIEVLKRGNMLAAMVDSWDTWGHDVVEWRNEAGRFDNARIGVFESGDVLATLAIVSRYNRSTAEQFVTLYRSSPVIDCRFRINWQERYTMLKLGYETCIEAGESTYDTAYGCQVRPTSGAEEPGQKWADLTGAIGGTAYGLAVLNDSKYGFDMRDGELRVSLLRSTAYAHHDPARHKASEPWPIMDQGWHRVHIQLVPHAGPWQSAGVVRRAWELNEPAVVHVESAHPGTLPGQASFLDVAAKNVALTVLKPAEDGGRLIVRGYETAGQAVTTRLEFPYWKSSCEVRFAPHEIKTFAIDPGTWTATEVNLLEEPLG